MPRRVSPWLKGFVIFHIVAITIWSIPEPPAALRQGTTAPRGSDFVILANWHYLKTEDPAYPTTIQPIIADYLLATGFWQYWDMFSPNPASIDFYSDAIVRYKDGTEKVWNYPRMEKLSNGEKFLKERYRKYYERVRQDDYSYLWGVYAQVAAAEMDTMPGNPPVNVRLRRNWIEIQPPDQPQWKKYSSFFYFDYVVNQVELRAAKGAK